MKFDEQGRFSGRTGCATTRRRMRIHPGFTQPQHFRVMVAASVRRITRMLNELGKLAVASTATTGFIWVLSLLAPCLPEHWGDLIRFAACYLPFRPQG